MVNDDVGFRFFEDVMIQSLHGVFKCLEIVLENAKIAHVAV